MIALLPDEVRQRTGFAVEISDLTRRFGPKVALDRIDLKVPAGSVFGLIGENGAGKTTIIKHILGLYKAQAGAVRVFGQDPVADPVGVLSRIGYLSEESDLPMWMRVNELMRYTQAFYSTWDEAYAETLRAEFALDKKAQIKSLSKGQRARAGLLAALAYRPELLLLDEPSSGLDPIVRRDILGAIVRTIADEGRTVLFSSHLLSEVERVCDYVAMIKNGRIVFCDSLDEIKAGHLWITLRFETTRTEPPAITAAHGWSGGGCEWRAVYCGPVGQAEAAAAVCGAKIVQYQSPSLNEIFVARTGGTAVPGQQE
jgi:ABC-2 type transport system ATP-binding protein